MKYLVLPVLLIALFGALHAAGQTIYDIRIKGNQNIDAELIHSAITVKIGDALSYDEISRSIKNLNRMNLFRDIQFESEPYMQGVIIIVTVDENPVVDGVQYYGFKVLKKDKIDELYTIRTGSYWTQQTKLEIISKLRKEYISRGYNNAVVRIEEKSLPGNRIAIDIYCDEGKRLAIRQITFVGNNSFEDKQLLKRMKTKPANLLRSGRFEAEKFEQDIENILAFYRKNGYVEARIVNWELKSQGDRSLELVIQIEEGSFYRYGGVEIRGNEFFTKEKLGALFTLKQGEAFDQERFDEQMAAVRAWYYEEGFIYSEIGEKTQKKNDLLFISVEIAEGPRARIRQIHFSGNRRTKEKVLRRQLTVAPGDYFRRSQVISSQQNIYNLGFFEPDIGLDYTMINSERDIDLHLDVIDKPSGTANGGIGYNSQDKLVGQLSVSQNNLFGNNWSSGLSWEFGGNTQNFELNFTNPNLYDTDILLGTNLYYTRKKWSSFFYEIHTRGGSLRLGQSIPLINRTRLIAGYSLYSKKYRITDRDQIELNPLANAHLIELDSLGWRYTSAVNVTFSRDTRDNVFFPTTGSQITLYSEVAGSVLGGDFDYFKQIAQVNWYMETWHKIALRTKWRYGYVRPYGSSKDVPPDEKFYLGGTGPDGIRGYPDRSVGPAGGGTRALLFSTELGYPLGSDQIIGVLFFDSGDSVNKLREFNLLKFKKGVGAGIRIRSPFGLIGFDYAYNVEDQSWEPHLQFGTTF
ncbi:MAG: outer membrane protein assembly factor BamA [Candidatus Cloacimonetes bacterium]|nr:outer membrane protein assembly factor BamA [Candidatus Cloacimonadota bacterium]